MDAIERALAAPEGLPEARRARLPEALLDALLGYVRERLAAGGFAPPDDLTRLHEHVPAAAQRLDGNYLNPVSIAFYAQTPALRPLYLRLVRWCAEELGGPVYFQRTPIFRFHFPGPFPPELTAPSGFPSQHHSDTLGGHPFGMVQVWVPLTPCAGSATLGITSRAAGVALLRDFREAHGLDAQGYRSSLRRFHAWVQGAEDVQERLAAALRQPTLAAGEALLFDPRCVHGGTANREGATRVSLDFRVLAPERYAVLEERGELGRFRRGEVLAEERSDAGEERSGPAL